MKLEDYFVYYTECQLATLEGLQERKSTSKSELKRQQKIADGMMAVVMVACKGLDITKCPRVSKLLARSM